tara:strand:+ start:170 stop:1006 length:837 start_codon:yes stop_codon:yes gene_type:complete
MIESVEEKLITGGMIPVEPKLRIISLGAGVQSSVMALMGDRGEFGAKPDCAIFADTQWEPAGVYEHLDWLEKELSFPVYRVTAGNIRENEIKGVTVDGHPYNTIPLFTEKGITRRQCTGDYKIKPVRKKTRELLGLAPKQRANGIFAEHWLGISLDEIVRMKDSHEKFVVHRFPLIEKRIERRHCLEWFAEHYPDRTLSRSACLGCPYNSNARWRELKLNAPDDFADVVDFDKKIRKLADMDFYIHKSCKPLDEVDLRNLEDMGQLSFLDECDGMCGV